MGKANQGQYQNYVPLIEEFSDSIITIADMAEVILDQSLYLSKKKNLMNEIDQALIQGKKELFMELTNQYNVLLHKHQYLKDYELEM